MLISFIKWSILFKLSDNKQIFKAAKMKTVTAAELTKVNAAKLMKVTTAKLVTVRMTIAVARAETVPAVRKIKHQVQSCPITRMCHRIHLPLLC